MYFCKDQILSATNGGLDIILSYYPEADTRKHFRIRDEKTPSASMMLKGGIYYVTDFGGDGKAHNAIEVCMKEDGKTFQEAVEYLSGRFGVGGVERKQVKAKFSKRAAKEDETEGSFSVDIKDTMSEFELKTLGIHVTQDVCNKWHFYALRSFSRVKNREVLTWESTDDYPIYLYDAGEYKKILQPLNPEKQFRFQYLGTVTPNILNGLSQLKSKYEELKKDINPETEQPYKEKLDEVIIMSGDRDALNMAAYGFNVLWLNSETSKIDPKQYREVAKMVESVYNLPDIDATGKREGIKLALTHIDIKTIWLPDYLLNLKDSRGYTRKDFRDWLDVRKTKSRVDIQREIERMLKLALPCRFWDVEVSEKGEKYNFNNVCAYYFLNCNGYYTIDDPNQKEGFSYIKITGNVVEKIKAKDMQRFVDNWLEEREMPIALRNMMYKTTQLGESSLMRIRQADLDFSDYGKDYQLFFFKNATWRVTATDIQLFDKNTNYVWKDEVLEHNVKRLADQFRIFRNEAGELDIEINYEGASKFLKYLINTCRIYWREENNRIDEDQRAEYWKTHKFDIAGPMLTDAEVYEQKQHLINKIFALGYLLHRYKNPSKPWCVFAMDNRISEMGKSFGGSGKSLFFRSVKNMMNSVTLGGRDPKITENKHIFERVDKYTDFLFIDDASQSLRFDFFFDCITGSMLVNPKNTQSYEINFDDSPKFGIASNFTIKNVDPSTSRRLLYTVFSDYYHALDENGEYQEERTVFDDFGKNLFFDYTEDEWNQDLNLMAECCRYYLATDEKINPPMANVYKRNKLAEMGDEFFSWANIYFTQEGTLDTLISKETILKEYFEKCNPRLRTTQAFSKRIQAWCQYYGYTLNPTDLCNTSDKKRIIKKEDGKTIEQIYIQTKDAAIDEFTKVSASDDKPF